MIISNSQRFIFVHIMKAAGTSITRTLDPFIQWNDLLLGPTPFGSVLQNFYRKRFNLHQHSRALEIKQVIGNAVWADYFKFTFVRHPYGRALSLYTWIKGMVESDGLKRFFPFKRLRKKEFWSYPGTQVFLNSRSFSEFIRNQKLLEQAPGFKPQAEWVLDGNGNIMVDFIGKVENIGDDFQYVAGKINCQPLELGVHNRSKSKNFHAEIINENDFEYLYRIFRLDFETFEYDPDPEKYRKENAF